jgi:hypothetical protein
VGDPVERIGIHYGRDRNVFLVSKIWRIAVQ